jgi:hypothetical protein
VSLRGIIATGWSAAVVKQIARRRGQARSRLREWDLGLRYDLGGHPKPAINRHLKTGN